MTQTTTGGAQTLRIGQGVRLAALGLVVLLTAAVLITSQGGPSVPEENTGPVGTISPSPAYVGESFGATGTEPTSTQHPTREGPAVAVPSSDEVLWDCCWTSGTPPQVPPTPDQENRIGGR